MASRNRRGTTPSGRSFTLSYYFLLFVFFLSTCYCRISWLGIPRSRSPMRGETHAKREQEYHHGPLPRSACIIDHGVGGRGIALLRVLLGGSYNSKCRGWLESGLFGQGSHSRIPRWARRSTKVDKDRRLQCISTCVNLGCHYGNGAGWYTPLFTGSLGPRFFEMGKFVPKRLVSSSELES